MSQENVEIVRGHIEAFTHDAPRALSFLDPFVVGDVSRLGSGGTYLGNRPAYGRETLEREVASYVGAFEGYAYEAERLTDLGGGAILAAVTETGRGREAALPYGTPSPCSTPSSTAGSRESPGSQPRRKPSKPLACGDRRCRRRTWRS